MSIYEDSEYQREVKILGNKLDDHEISFAMYLQEAEKLKKKYQKQRVRR